MLPKTKLCPHCKKRKSVSLFYYNNVHKHYETNCKVCHNQLSTAWMRKDYQIHPEKILIRRRRDLKYRAKNLEKVRERDRRVHKSYYKKNREIILVRVKLWRSKFPDKCRAIQRECGRVARVRPQIRILAALRTRMNQALRGLNKSAHTEKLLGCSVEYLKLHLEKQFQPGMTWENYGKWHRDEIQPCSSFDLTKKSEQRKCFHYTNMQPLWASDNIRKGAKVI